jgi:uncharacterized protein (TIRG00374 family)
VALAAGLLLWALPAVAGADWGAIGAAVGQLTALEVAVLVVVWQLGLVVHTVALAAAMPGLSHRRAYFLNLTGSAVSNVLPLGGAAGTALNYTTARAWGFRTDAFLRWALVTNIWDTLGKLVVPGVALVWLALEGTPAPRVVTRAALGAVVLLAVLVVVTWLALHRDVVARPVGRVLDWSVARVARSARAEDTGYATEALRFRRDTAALVARAWVPLTVGKAGYAALQAFLLWLCLRWLGGDVSPAVAFAAYAAERVLSLAVLTPGGSGVVEVGMTGVLVAFGVEPAVAAAAVLVYRALVVGMEVPTGGAAMGWWLVSRRRTQGRP